MTEKTLIFLKPSGMEKKDTILKILDEIGEPTHFADFNSVPRELIEKHYSCHKGKWFYDTLIDFLSGKKMLVLVYESNDAVKRFTEASAVIRKNFSKDIYDNAIHRTGSKEEFEQEFDVWKDYLTEIK